ncbi:3-carboxymuconate cyclase [Herbaspirillum sp. CF444]|uniref:lactonase family protein n=1 Tax=Herbaspirillum sp. CF444 TaxID=1144319 RepID=UPI00027251C7|nr:beta-propeller fold lactonase family protein [Herbaspirillum sp. CF444]EJL88383.1 3-carboxymuconate cyclase [Herbaspirillum sp. CF444]
MGITHFALKLGVAAVLSSALCAGVNAATMVYVSNADSKDIYVMRLNRDGSVTPVEQVQTGGTVMPLAFSPDHRRLYASLRSQPYSVTTFAVDQQSGKLRALSTVPLADNMANLATDKTGRFLFAASYTGHKISVNPISAAGLVQGPAVVINTGKNAHAVGSDPKNNFVFASNLGSDVILQFKFDVATGTLTPNTPPSVATKAGAGPRHFVFHPNLRYVFSTNELDGTVNTYAYDAAHGTLTLQGSVSVVPAGFKGDAPAAADIHLTPDGRFLYASERTSSTLAAFRVNAATGALTLIGNVPTETQPRGFNIDPQGKYLLAVGQKSNGLTSYAINQKTGALTPLQHYELGKNPNWVEIVSFP